MKTLGTMVVALFAGFSMNAHALQAAVLCDIESGAPVASYMAFVVDWNDFGASAAPTMTQVAAYVPSPMLIDPIQTSATVAEIGPASVAPVTVRPRPAPAPVAVQLVAEQTPVVERQQRPVAPTPMPWPSSLRNVWFIGSFR